MFKVTGAPGNAQVFRQIARLPESMRRGLKKANLLIGPAIQKTIRRKMEAKKSGRVYSLVEFWAGNRIIRHRASAPGEAPARLSGSLKASVGYVASMDQLIIGAGNTNGEVGLVKQSGYPGQVDLGGQIGFGRTVDYAARLELIMNRPYLKVSINENRRNTENYYYRETERELKRL
jgi:hypothetical protein